MSVALPPTAGTAAATTYTGYIQRGTTRVTLNVKAASDFSDADANVALLPNDYVHFSAVPPIVVFIQGSVRDTGDLALPRGSGVIEAIAGAGGLTDAPDKVKASVRREGKAIDVDLGKAFLTNDPKADVTLREGDIVLISPLDTINVVFSGDFFKPGSVPLPLNTGLFDGIARAGGLSVAVDLARINLLRNGADGKRVVLKIDPVGLFRASDLSQNVKLQDGDLVNASEVKQQTIYVSGEVAQTGSLKLSENEGIADAITQAGGPTAKAALRQVVVERNGGSQIVDTYDAVKEGAPLNFPLQDGDYVVVPAIKKKVLVIDAAMDPNYFPLPEKGDLSVLRSDYIGGRSHARCHHQVDCGVTSHAHGNSNPRLFARPDWQGQLEREHQRPGRRRDLCAAPKGDANDPGQAARRVDFADFGTEFD